MRPFLKCSFLLLILLPVIGHTQFIVGSAGMTVQAGATLMVDSLVLQPSITLTLAGTEITKSNTAIGSLSGATSIQRVYRFSNPVSFTGRLGIFYNDAELSANTENGLQLAYLANGMWTTTSGSNTSPTQNYVSNTLNSAVLARLTATSSSQPLPVTLLYFSAQKTQHDLQALISWSAADEAHLLRYAVERSNDGKTFERLGTQQPNGGAAYRFTDRQPLPGINYYRLLMEEDRGVPAYSQVRALTFSNTASTEITLTPNPATQEINVHTADVKAGTTVLIMSAAGSQVARFKLTGLHTTFSVSSLQPGVYLLQAGKDVLKFEKQ